MTIVSPAKMLVSGVFQEGHQISCHSERCSHASAFFPDRNHLPPQVVQNKFRDKGWEVNSDGRDYCPSCRIVRRERKASKTGTAGAAEKSMRDARTVKYANAANARGLISGVGLLPTEVIELEHKDTKFKITFRNMLQIPLGQLTAAEGELVTVFNAALVASSLKFEVEQRVEKSQYIFEPVIHWYITMAVQKNQNAHLRIAAE